ncbi:hypothetical protein HMPREF0889_1248 [Megasphaera lornae]|uniref:Uncharacterized protein n=1 Tax=Megasphaera lornae TaxID=1000568 RepID=D3LWA6_9FIRM|nr:hypothetical protein HMPREF0889_1248 [Megasphaera genomosp. type_1 str. 28L]
MTGKSTLPGYLQRADGWCESVIEGKGKSSLKRRAEDIKH